MYIDIELVSPFVEAASEVLKSFLFDKKFHFFIERGSRLWRRFGQYDVEGRVDGDTERSFVTNRGGAALWVHAVLQPVCRIRHNESENEKGQNMALEGRRWNIT